MSFHTLGCKVNQYDTEAMMARFRQTGYRLVDEDDAADVVVVNTCTVTHLGDRKSRQLIRRARRGNPAAIIVATGCYAQTAPGKLAELPEVDLVVGNEDREHIVELVEAVGGSGEASCQVSNIMDVHEFGDTPIDEFIGRTRATIKVQEGCNEYCSYCIIPYARGRQRSRPLQSVTAEARRLVDHGFVEVVLAGIHLSSYGADLPDNQANLATLVEALHDIDDLRRLRLSSVEPMGLTRDLLRRIAGLPKVCRHLHLPLQSGADTVLQRMGRNYTTDQFRELVNVAREYMPGVNVSTDVMVGFPGETGEEFERGLRFIKDMEFGRIHAFRYSRRRGTRAYYLPDQVSSPEKASRQEQLLEVAFGSMRRFHEQFLGQVLDVLVEEYDGNWASGYTDNYIRVQFDSRERGAELAGSIVPVRLETVRGDLVAGELVGTAHG